jgi:hypothetical protein
MVLFGKGKVGGIDVEEQLENTGKYEKLVRRFTDKGEKTPKERDRDIAKEKEIKRLEAER